MNAYYMVIQASVQVFQADDHLTLHQEVAKAAELGLLAHTENRTIRDASPSATSAPYTRRRVRRADETEHEEGAHIED